MTNKTQSSKKKLSIARETLRNLKALELQGAAGGAMVDTTCTVYYSYCKCPKPNPY